MAKKFMSSGEADLVTVLRKVVTVLNEQADIVRGGLFHTLPGAMNDRVEQMGVLNVPHIILLMQELGLLRRWGGGGATVWQVLCITFFEEVMVGAWVERAEMCLQKHIETTDSLRILKARVATLEASPAPAVGTQSIDEIATMVVQLEGLQRDLAARDEQIANLERVLTERPVFDPDAALAAAIKRVRERLPSK